MEGKTDPELNGTGASESFLRSKSDLVPNDLRPRHVSSSDEWEMAESDRVEVDETTNELTHDGDDEDDQVLVPHNRKNVDEPDDVELIDQEVPRLESFAERRDSDPKQLFHASSISDSDSEQEAESAGRPQVSLTQYMEEASMETVVVEDVGSSASPSAKNSPTTLKIHAAGRMGRRGTMKEDILLVRGDDVEDSMEFTVGRSQASLDSSSSLQDSFHGHFQSFREINENNLRNELSVGSPSKRRDRSSKYLRAMGTSSLTVPEEEEFTVLELLVENNILPENTKDEDQATLLHLIFEGFCFPNVEMAIIESVLDLESNLDLSKCSNIRFPDQPTLLNPERVIQLLSAGSLTKPLLLRFPTTFLSAFFRILIRLMTPESDEEYNVTCFLVRPVTDSYKTLLELAEEGPHDPDYALRRPHLLYTFARFQQYWNQHCIAHLLASHKLIKDDRPSLQMLWNLWVQGVSSKHWERPVLANRFLAPLARLMGLLSVAGISPWLLRRMLTGSQSSIISNVARISLVRALRTAASGASRPAVSSKSPPRSFFSFSASEGSIRTLTGLSAWPFRNDFGMAVWFRVERCLDRMRAPTILSVRSDDGGGIEVSLAPLHYRKASEEAYTVTLSVYDSHHIKPKSTVTVKGCLILNRVWYHLAVRHSRSRLKGVFSMSTRQQLSIILDGKVLLSDSLDFPSISGVPNDDSASSLIQAGITAGLQQTGLKGLRKSFKPRSRFNLKICFAQNFEGQMGTLYIFNDHVGDSSFRALYEATGGSVNVIKRSSSVGLSWDARKSAIVKRSRVLDASMTNDDADEIVLSHRRSSRSNIRDLNPSKISVLDVGQDEDEDDLELPPGLLKSQFGARVFLSWDPQRTVGGTVIELHVGAHLHLARSDFAWSYTAARDVISSIGGVQFLVSVFRMLLIGEKDRKPCFTITYNENVEEAFSPLPDLLCLLASFVNEHNENAREYLRCGGVDLLEQLIFSYRRSLSGRYFRAVKDNLSTARRLVQSLLALHRASMHYLGLETKIFSRLVFNLPLWLGGLSTEEAVGNMLQLELLGVLSHVAKTAPEKVSDCVGTRDMVLMCKVYLDAEEQQLHDSEGSDRKDFIFDVTSNALDVLLSMLFSILSTGATPDDLYPLLTFVSSSLESERLGDGDKSMSKLQKDPKLRELFNVKVAAIFYFLLQIRPPVPGLYESFVQCCGNVEGAAGWLLATFVNSQSDRLRSYGVRSLAAFLDFSSKNLDLQTPADAATALLMNAEDQQNSAGSLRGLGIIAKGIAAMGPGVRSMVAAHTALNVQVVVKLLWHYLKSHQSDLDEHTRAALFGWMSDDNGILTSTISSQAFLQEHLISEDESSSSLLFSLDSCEQLIASAGTVIGRSLGDPLALMVVLRLVRFLDLQTQLRWISDILVLARASRRSLNMLALSADWQPLLFMFIAEALEHFASDRPIIQPGVDIAESTASAEIRTNGADETRRVSVMADVEKLAQVSLELYSCLLGYLFREGGDKGLDAIERAASLQRVCVNGNQCLLLILSSLCGNLFDHGTLRDINTMTTMDWKEIDIDYDSPILKQSARLVTDAILSNGTKGLDMASAVRSWKSLRHLAEVIVAVITANGFGATELFDYANERGAAMDCASRGLHGIRLPETRLYPITAKRYQAILTASQGGEMDVKRRLCAELATQTLIILDYFLFPDSLDGVMPSSQLHAMALLRSADSRLGTSQGPMLVSALRLSFLLMSNLEPCSVRFLQAVVRLRSLLLWTLEFIREVGVKESVPGQTPSPPIPNLDRLVLIVVLHSHRALGRCAAVISEIEESSPHVYFESSEMQKKFLRRILRVVLELRDIVATSYRSRTDLFLLYLSAEAADALRRSLESGKSSPSKESLAKEFLRSDWVSSYQDIEERLGLVIPEQLWSNTVPVSSDPKKLGEGIAAIEALTHDSKSLIADFERVQDTWFEEYLERQKNWAETDAVRKLEIEGNQVLNRFSEKFKLEKDATASVLARRAVAENRWTKIQKKVVRPWMTEEHWMLARYTDRKGRRTMLVPNVNFIDHTDARYEQGDPSTVYTSRHLEEDISEVVRRNAEAFISSQTSNSNEVAEMECFSQTSDDEDASSSDGEQLAKPDDRALEDSDQDEEWDKVEPNDVVGVDAEDDQDAWARVFIWSDGEAVLARFDSVMIVSLRSYVEGLLLLTTHGLYFRPTSDEFGSITREPVVDGSKSDTGYRRWRLARLTEVHGRRYMLRPQALELFFSDSHELFLNFPGGSKERDMFYMKLRNGGKTPMLWSPKSLNPRTVFRKSRLTELWRKRQISNFEYIMALNRMAGRSFNDITQYPIFPWILADYTSQEIDLSDIRIYRDLTKPIGALNPDRLAQFIERYKDLELFGFEETEKFLYGSHYSSPGIVLHYLIRQEPFTTMAIELQSGRFDCPDRLFCDLADSWNSCLTSTSDMKELIPEFFCLPEMFVNTNKFPLGRTQRGVSIDDVGLPPWAKGSPYEFVRIHRLALESELVSQSLNHWVDLIFGYKQRGPEAMTAYNLFHHLSYEGSVDLEKIADDVDRKAAESHIQNFGQTPSQLIPSDPHPTRYPLDQCWKPLIHNLSVPKNLRCHTPAKQFGNKRSEHAKGSVMAIHVLSDSLLAIYGDLSVGVYRWSPKSKRDRLKMDRLSPLSRRELSTSRASIKRGSTIGEKMMETSCRAIGNWSFAVTVGGRTRELIRRNALSPPTKRLLASSDNLMGAETGGYIVSCGYWDEGVRLHSAETLRQAANERGGHQGPVKCLATGQDGGLLAIGSQDGSCSVWVIDHPDMSIALSDGYVQTALGASNDGRNILSCCHILWGHDTPVTSITLDSDLDVVVSGSEAGLICIHTARLGDFIRSFRPLPVTESEGQPPIAVEKLAVHSSGNIVAHMNDGGLHTYTVNGVLLCSADAGDKLNDMKICSSGEILVTGGLRGLVVIRTIWDLSICAALDLSRHGPVRCISITPAELNPAPQYFFIGSDDGMITIVDEDMPLDRSSTSLECHQSVKGLSFWTA